MICCGMLAAHVDTHRAWGPAGVTRAGRRDGRSGVLWKAHPLTSHSQMEAKVGVFVSLWV